MFRSASCVLSMFPLVLQGSLHLLLALAGFSPCYSTVSSREAPADPNILRAGSRYWKRMDGILRDGEEVWRLQWALRLLQVPSKRPLWREVAPRGSQCLGQAPGCVRGLLPAGEGGLATSRHEDQPWWTASSGGRRPAPRHTLWSKWVLSSCLGLKFLLWAE